MSPDRAPHCWRVTYRRQCKKRTGTGRGKKGEKSTVMLLPRHSFAQPIYSKSGSMIYCKLKNKATASHRWAASSPGHFNTDRSNSVAELDPVSFTSTHCYRQSFRGILVTTTARQILPSRPTGGWENRLKGIVESIVLSGGVTCRQKCPDYSSPRYFQLSGTCLWLSKKRG